MGNKKKPDLSESSIGLNPFSIGLVVRMRKSVLETINEKGVAEKIDFEYDPYFKVYADPAFRLAKSALKPRESQVWDWMMYTVDSGMDAVWVDVERCKKECGIKDDKTYRQAIVGLAAAGWIAICPKVKNVFFINPSYGFKGSRAKKYPENIQYVGK